MRQLDDAVIARLEAKAGVGKTSVEAIARAVLTEAAASTTEEKIASVEKMRDWGRRAINPDVPQTPTLDLIREDRDRDH